jgi:hypothetical protein
MGRVAALPVMPTVVKKSQHKHINKKRDVGRKKVQRADFLRNKKFNERIFLEQELQQAQEVYNLNINYLSTYNFQILTAIIIMILGSIVARPLIVESCLGIFALFNPKLAVAVVRDTIESLAEVSKYKVPQMRVDEFADSSINTGMCYWVPTTSMSQTRFKVNMTVVKALAEKNIETLYSKRGVYIIDQPQA